MTPCEAWTDKHIYDEAEARYHSYLAGNLNSAQGAPCTSSKQQSCGPATSSVSLDAVAAENIALRQLVAKLEATMISVTARLDTVEAQLKATTISSPTKASSDKKAPDVDDDDDDDEVDLFGSDDEEEDAEAARIREERLKAYAE